MTLPEGPSSPARTPDPLTAYSIFMLCFEIASVSAITAFYSTVIRHAPRRPTTRSFHPGGNQRGSRKIERPHATQCPARARSSWVLARSTPKAIGAATPPDARLPRRLPRKIRLPPPRNGTKTSLCNRSILTRPRKPTFGLAHRATAAQFTGVDSSHFGAEHGQSPTEPLAIPVAAPLSNWHGEAFWNHQNSVFNARTFFQVGPVLPSHRNAYGFRRTTEAGPFGYLFQRLAAEDPRHGEWERSRSACLRTHASTTDPAARAIVQRFLDAYPDQLPNRPDFDARALNANRRR